MAAMQLLHALSFGVFHACCMQLISIYVPGRLSTHGQALLYGLGSGVGGVIGALLAGVAWRYGGGEAAFLAGAVACLAALATALRLRDPNPDIDLPITPVLVNSDP
jgi:PPP family 3-phenylpropionic acid transporter